MIWLNNELILSKLVLNYFKSIVMKKFLFFLVIVVFAVSCSINPKPKNTTQKVTTERNDTFRKLSIFEGTLPCADCSCVKTVLKISTDYSVPNNNKYELISIYMRKKSPATLIQQGNFNTERGLENDPDGTIYVLNWDKPEEKQIYYGYFSTNPEKIFLLDRNRKTIKSQMNYSLNLKK